MPELLSFGAPITLVANQIYALPGVRTTLFTDATTPTIQQSNNAAFTANVAVTLVAGTATLGGGFVRATTNTLIVLSRE